MTVRFYSSTAQETTLQVGINNSATVILVAATTGFPASLPYTLAIDYESGTEELVDVTGAAGLSLTVTRAVDGTSAAAHSAGARVRHVSSARDFRDSRDHENDTDGVHGLAPTDVVVGTNATQTLNNKTLASPTITGTVAGGASYTSPTLTGTVGGSASYTTPTIAGGTFSGTIAGTPTYSGIATHTAKIQSSRTNATDVALGAKITTDTTDRFNISEAGALSWGPGGVAAPDTSISRTGIAQLTLNSDLTMSVLSATSVTTTGDVGVGGNFAVTGIGQVQPRRKSADTSRASTVTPTIDPHLVVNVVAGATYIFDSGLMIDSNAASAGFQATVGGTAAGTLSLMGQGPHNSITTGSSVVGEWIARDNVTTPVPFGTSTTAGVQLSGRLFGTYACSVSGTLGIQWSQRVSSGTATILKVGSWFRAERMA